MTNLPADHPRYPNEDLSAVVSLGTSYDHIMLWASFCLSFFGFMHSGEFTCPSWRDFNCGYVVATGCVGRFSHFAIVCH